MKNKLIVALDVPELAKAQELVNTLGETVNYYKVGLELFLNTRGEVLDFLKAKDKKVFLDLKFHDIPNTITQAAKWAAGLGVDMFNVHASGGEVMLATTMETVKNSAVNNGYTPPLVIGVTVLTSFDEVSFNKVGFKYSIDETVLHWSQLCQKAGLDGVVCSPREAANIKSVCGNEFITVCPGVRPCWTELQDQKRITTPGEAIKMGADYLVVGRPITKNSNPCQAALRIIKEMEGEE
ncbi:MAG: orotidine-5-phosphate decarboxylase [Clostridia bacterium]|jgi:orotidine-5'-phosphate decarboxylase|nr:orotidine-5-phosphate decarboxylase [Clostridia bacterium]MDN5322456.1 orotidine-5-phosphate decarboxylase [Clostridia bacterium]